VKGCVSASSVGQVSWHSWLRSHSTSSRLSLQAQKELEEKVVEVEQLQESHQTQVKEMEENHKSAMQELNAQLEELTQELHELHSQAAAILPESTVVDIDNTELDCLRAELEQKTEQINALLKEHEELKESNEKLFNLDMEVEALEVNLSSSMMPLTPNEPHSGETEMIRELEGKCKSKNIYTRNSRLFSFSWYTHKSLPFLL
jgi:ABC-type phosphate transport system auxiliary subunit